MSRTTTLAELQQALTTSVLDDRVRALHRLADVTLEVCEMSVLEQAVLQEEAYKTLYVIKENTFVRAEALSEFTKRVAHALQGNVEGIRQVFAEFRDTRTHFLPLHGRIAVVHSDDYDIACAVPPKGFVVLVSSGTRDYMPDYDFSLAQPKTKQWLLAQYNAAIRRTPTCQICLVKKEFGPEGPLALLTDLERLSSLMGSSHNVFVYDQRTSMTTHGCPQPDTTVVVLYDLIDTGKGLVDIAKGLRTLGVRAAIQANVLYAFNSHTQKCQELETHFTDITVLHQQSLRNQLRNVRPHAIRPALKRRSTEDINPLAGANADLGIDMHLAYSDELVRHYPGEWVAIRDGQVLAHSMSYDQAVRQAGTKDVLVRKIEVPGDPSYEFLLGGVCLASQPPRRQ